MTFIHELNLVDVANSFIFLNILAACYHEEEFILVLLSLERLFLAYFTD
jgi:hypothetical protein